VSSNLIRAFCFAPNAKKNNREGFLVVRTSLAAQWEVLDDHFRRHATLVNRFRHAGPNAVVHMWKSQSNEHGDRLSQYERDALVESHCELFGTWPD